jgi:hypothetical protein
MGASAPSGLRPILEDRFASDPGPWPNDPQSTAWAADGVYRLVVRQPGQFVALGRPLTEAYRDVVVSTRVRTLGGPGGGEYGLIVRDQGPGPRDGSNQTGRFYVLRANDRGEANVAWREDDHWVELVPWTPSDAIHRGNTVNELAALAIGSRLGLMVNGSLIASVEDGALAAGAVGLYVGGDSPEVAFETFRIEVPS